MAHEFLNKEFLLEFDVACNICICIYFFSNRRTTYGKYTGYGVK